MLGDLGDILDDLKQAVPVPAPVRGWSGGDASSLSTAFQGPNKAFFSEADKLPSYLLALSEYERHWLECRIEVHLRSYEAVDWSEMKEVLQTVLTKLRGLKNGHTNSETTVASDQQDYKDPSQSG
jgi:hypothetical protein